MAILYKLYQDTRKKKGTEDPFNQKTYGKWFARAVNVSTIETKQLAEKISYSASATVADTVAVLNSLTQVMSESLKDGCIVKLDGFGSWRIGIKSTPVDTPKDFSASKNIVGVHINFMPEYTMDNATGKANVPMLDGVKFKETVKN